MSVGVAINPNVRTDTTADTAADEYKDSVTFFLAPISMEQVPLARPRIVAEVEHLPAQTRPIVKTMNCNSTVEMTATGQCRGTLCVDELRQPRKAPVTMFCFTERKVPSIPRLINYGTDSLTVTTTGPVTRRSHRGNSCRKQHREWQWQQNQCPARPKHFRHRRRSGGVAQLVSVGTPADGTISNVSTTNGTFVHTPNSNFSWYRYHLPMSRGMVRAILPPEPSRLP